MITRKHDTIYMTDAIGMTYCNVKAPNVCYPEHYHDFVELVYMLKGKCIHTVDKVDYPSRHGDMIVINYGQLHEIKGDSDIEYVNLYIKPEYVDAALTNNEDAFALLNLGAFDEFSQIVDTERCRVNFSGTERDNIEKLLFLMLDELNGSAPGADLALRSQLNILLISFFRKTSLSFGDSFDCISDSLLAYIKRNLGQKLTLSDVTDRCPYNSSYFSRLFKKYTGLTFTEYLKRERIERAKELLVTGSGSIEQVLSTVGYSDRTKFYKDFKSLVGLTPLEYRKSKN